MNRPRFLAASVAIQLLLSISGFAQPAPSYREPWRPQFHFTPPTNWMNDPNGLVHYDGEYHLFYQFNPFGDKWGHMSWGHAVSRDLTHWKHLPVALHEENDIMIFSGSAVVDWKNTSGFGRNGKPPLVAIYTGHYTKKPLQNQQIAYSNDRGRTWTKYAGNPVLDIGEKDFRDPKVIWHEPTKRWIMTVAWPVHRQVRFYSSPNLKDWTHLSDFGPAGSTNGIWECPDLFPMAVKEVAAGGSILDQSGPDTAFSEPRAGELSGARAGRQIQKWVLIVNVGSGAPAGGSGGQYFVGDFDGREFRLDSSFPKPRPEYVPEGIVLADFEGADYAGWQSTGDAFGPAPARGRIGGQQAVAGFRGRGLVNTFLDGDKSEGTLTSPEFEIARDHLSFLIGGGNHAGRTCLNLLVEDRTVRTATGDNAERLSWKSWDVRDLRGRKARLEIVDRHTGGWGHLNVDQVILADAPARSSGEAALWMDHGPDYYAAVTWSDIPRRDGRRLAIGWMSNWQYAEAVPTSPWRSAMSLPRELTLLRTADGLRLAQQPVRELRTLREGHQRLRNASIREGNEWIRRKNIGGDELEIDVEFEVSDQDKFGLNLLQGAGEVTVVGCDVGTQRLFLDRTRSGRSEFHPQFAGRYEIALAIRDGRLRLRVFVDTSSVGVFANDGEPVLTALALPGPTSHGVEFWSSSGNTTIKRVEVWKLKSAWR